METDSKEDFLNMLEQYQGILHKVNLLYFRNPADREDNFQEMVYQLWRSYPRLKNRESIGSYMYKVAINTSIVKLKKDRKNEHSNDIQEIAADDDVEKQMEEKENANMLINAICELNEIDRAIMLLYLEEKSYEEIAGITGISAGNAGVRIARAKKALKEKLRF